jgi:hypothetical protein
MIWTRLIFLHVCGGLKFEGRINREVRGFVKFPFSAQRAVEAKERTAVAIANVLMLKNREADQPENRIVFEEEVLTSWRRRCCGMKFTGGCELSAARAYVCLSKVSSGKYFSHRLCQEEEGCGLTVVL